MQIVLEQPLTQWTVADLVALIERVLEEKLNAGRAAEDSLARRLELRAALARECARLDPAEEQAWAELGMAAEAEQWPAY